MHKRFDVSANESFYNKAKQTSVGFDTQGVLFTNEKKAKWSRAALQREKNKTVEQKAHTSMKKSESYQLLSVEVKQLRIEKQLAACDYNKRSLKNAKNGTTNYYRIYDMLDVLVFEGVNKDYHQWLLDNKAPYSSFMSSFENQNEIVGARRRIASKYKKFKGYWVSKEY